MEKIKKQVSFYAKMNEINNVYFSDMPMILIVYKKEFNTNKLNYCIPSIYVSLLYDYEDIFPNKTLSELNIELILYLKKQYLTNQPIEVILTRQKKFKCKWMS
jgi:hypothetical protein